jgi:hypothetical protein
MKSSRLLISRQTASARCKRGAAFSSSGIRAGRTSASVMGIPFARISSLSWLSCHQASPYHATQATAVRAGTPSGTRNHSERRNAAIIIRRETYSRIFSISSSRSRFG